MLTTKELELLSTPGHEGALAEAARELLLARKVVGAAQTTQTYFGPLKADDFPMSALIHYQHLSEVLAAYDKGTT